MVWRSDPGAIFMTRTRVPSDSEFWVSLSGNDTNPGTQPLPWRTLQYAWDRILWDYDFGPPAGRADPFPGPIVHVGNTTTTTDYEGVLCRGEPVGLAGMVLFEADAAQGHAWDCAVVPSVLSRGLGNCFYADNGARIAVSGFYVANPNGLGDCLGTGGGGSILSLERKGSLFDIVASPGAPAPAYGHMTAASGAELLIGRGATSTTPYAYSIVHGGGGQYHITAGDYGRIYYCTNGTPGLVSVYLYGTPAFTAGFACAPGGFINGEAIAWQGVSGGSGSTLASGPVGLAVRNGIVDGGAGNPSYWPGTLPPTIGTGGQFEGWP